MQLYKQEIQDEIVKILKSNSYGVKPNEAEYEARKIMYGSFVYEQAREIVYEKHANNTNEEKENMHFSGNV
jgi:hypothetical protein